MNAYIRFKLTLTEATPPLKPYDETRWAELVDGRTEDPAISLGILDGVHHRLHRLLSTLDARRLHADRALIPNTAPSRSTGCSSSTHGTGATTSDTWSS